MTEKSKALDAYATKKPRRTVMTMNFYDEVHNMLTEIAEREGLTLIGTVTALIKKHYAEEFKRSPAPVLEAGGSDE